MKRKVLICSLIVIFAGCAFGLAACNFFRKPDPSDNYTEVTYHLNGGRRQSEAAPQDTYTERVKEDWEWSFKTLTPVKDTWYFEGWYTDSEFTNKFEKLSSEDNAAVDLYAHWLDKVTVTKENFTEFFKVSSRWNGGLTIPGAAVNYSFTPIYVIDPLKSKDSIVISATPSLGGWSGGERQITLSEENDYNFAGSSLITQEVSFHLSSPTLKYEVETEGAVLYLLHKDPFSVTLELDGGILDSNTLTVVGGDTLKTADLPTPVKEGYRFMGWYNAPQFDKEYSDKIITRDTTLYAKFVQEVVIAFDTYGGSEKETLTYLLGDTLSLGENPVKDNFGFFGWYIDPDFKEEFTDTHAIQSRTLYARWEPVRTVAFDTHGGSEKQSVQLLNTQTLTEKDLSEPYKSSFIFDGWYTDDTYAVKYNGEPVTDDMTLHARWCYRYTGLSYSTNENMKEFFNVDYYFEKKQVTEGNYKKNKVFTYATLELKDEFKDKYFIIGFNVHINYYGADGTFYGNQIEKMTISTLHDETKAEFEVSNDYASIYANTDRVELVFYYDWSEIRFPEGYIPPV